jgi:chemotaxis protein MotB
MYGIKFMRRPRYHHAESSHNQDRWLLTYADMITLLTAFFLMLYSMSVMSKGKFSQLAVSVRSGFSGSASGGGKLLPASGTSINLLGLSALEYRDYTQAMLNLRKYVEQNKLSGEVSTRSDERGIVISLIADNMLFERGKADLHANSTPVLTHVAKVLKSSPNRVTIEGHTCDLPIHTAQFPSNWELSSARAGALLRYFTGEQGLSASRFMAAGYADTRPLLSNTSEANRARNRRVDIVILKTDGQREVDLVRRAEIRRISVSGVSDTSPGPTETNDQPNGAQGLNPDPGAALWPSERKIDNNDGRQGNSALGP